MGVIKSLESKIVNQLYRWFKYPKIHKVMKKYKACSVSDTIDNLINNKKSLSRFGDGEFAWILMDSKVPFEKNSKLLSHDLLNVLMSNDNNLDISLPNIFYKGGKTYSYKAKRFYKAFMAKEGYKILPFLRVNKKYYNTDISRLYTGHYCNKEKAKNYFNKIKQLWNGQNLLIIEGNGTRFGVGNNLLANANHIKRIECPTNNAFESYKKILSASLKFLHCHTNYISILSLGPTATVLAYALSKHDFRAIDLGHLDLEYEWYLMGVHKKVNIPDRSINSREVSDADNATPVHNKKYFNEIVSNID